MRPIYYIKDISAPLNSNNVKYSQYSKIFNTDISKLINNEIAKTKNNEKVKNRKGKIPCIK